MKKFLSRILALSIPFDIVLALYLILDPFRVVWHYDKYYSSTNHVAVNRGYASTCMYDNNYRRYHYDSFIFGNSRSLVYSVEEWKKYIPASSVCYHFDCSGGNIEDLYYKIKYINQHGEKVRNALFIIDRELLSHITLTGLRFEVAPQLKGNENYFDFQRENFEAFVTPSFFTAYIDYHLTHEFKDYMDQYLIQYPSEADLVTNEIHRHHTDSLILSGEYYTEERVKIFANAQFPDSIAPAVLEEKRKKLLTSIHDLLTQNNTEYRIIINPLYDQVRLNPRDVKFLKQTFGKDKVFDFSGPNKWNKDYHNYYETSHYRACVANDILSMIYK